ncbi:PfkB family carbohydrate kinase [Alkaliphilus peptidifermentans]|uniref:Fructoselysine 6-kinase n=1 Tax=Alkaliphilus peptidifermentans DSM 18978 TaxID=1120976 RepID=A0A1G5HR47_9FIRM|nr:PfkB family carbohydrate kinase [Alkaliphilus peptidifermentans]SCY66217.1 fructoselysine 6-kinase [Alkaliphilus peptidifermentans DSM 18978]
MKIITVGDNVADCYLDQGLYYPGGNCVNVAINSIRNGCERSAYIGIFGNDKKGDHIKWALDQEGVEFNYSRTMIGISGQPMVDITGEGDRVFVGGPKNTVQHTVALKLTLEDLEYISLFDVVHTSCYSNLEYELPKIKKYCDIAFDFSDYRHEEYLDMVCPHIKYGFMSGADLTSEEINQLIDSCHRLGTEVIGITLGSKGAIFSHNGQIFKQEIIPTNVVDTMGAGDSFIAGFLTSYIDHKDMIMALNYAAKRAANSCTISGAFGYPKPL